MVRTRLLHYSAYPDLRPHSVSEQPVHFKPRGLWLSSEGDDDWPSWCRSEDYGLDRLKHVFEIKLRADARVMFVSTIDALEEFTSEFAERDAQCINWPRVQASGYDGIVIAPYQWERRLSTHTSWYYAWDCASGCLWNADAIASLKKIVTDRMEAEAQG